METGWCYYVVIAIVVDGILIVVVVDDGTFIVVVDGILIIVVRVCAWMRVSGIALPELYTISGHCITPHLARRFAPIFMDPLVYYVSFRSSNVHFIHRCAFYVSPNLSF